MIVRLDAYLFTNFIPLMSIKWSTVTMMTTRGSFKKMDRSVRSSLLVFLVTLYGTSKCIDNTGFRMGEYKSTTNFQTFRDCLATPLIEKSTSESSKSSRKTRGNGRRRTAIKPVTMESDDANNAEDLADSIDVNRCNTTFQDAEELTIVVPGIRDLHQSSF
jgi:hypothetical protein